MRGKGSLYHFFSSRLNLYHFRTARYFLVRGHFPTKCGDATSRPSIASSKPSLSSRQAQYAAAPPTKSIHYPPSATGNTTRLEWRMPVPPSDRSAIGTEWLDCLCKLCPAATSCAEFQKALRGLQRGGIENGIPIFKGVAVGCFTS